MTQADLEAFVGDLPNVQRVENLGYTFFFVGDDHRIPFVTVASSDNEFDNVSNLDRKGVYRVNIGVTKETFKELFRHPTSEFIDYSKRNVFMPHPHYSRQHFVCILNPEDDNVEKVRRFALESHSIAAARQQRKRED